MRAHPGTDLGAETSEVLGQRKLLQWTVPGVAHFLTLSGFTLLLLTMIESYGALFSRTFSLPWIGHWPFIGFLEDLVAVGVLAGIITFAVIRLRNDPRKEGRASRFYGSHTGAAWLVLGMIFLVIATLLLYRGAQINTGVFPYAARRVRVAGRRRTGWRPWAPGSTACWRSVFLLAQLAVVIGFLVFVAYSKHLHIFLAPVNVLFCRKPDALGALEPMRSNGKVLDFEEADPDTDVFGVGKIEDFDLEGHARPGHLHRVRAVPVAVPGLGHRQAAVAQAGHLGPA